MAGPERVLILHDYGGSRGGAELIALDLRRLLTERGIGARLFTSDADPWRPEEAPDATCRGSTGRLRALREAYNPSAVARLRAEIAAFRPDIVHIVMFMTQLSPAILPVLEGVPTLYSANTYRSVCPTGLRWREGDGICHRRAGFGCRAAGCFDLKGVLPRAGQLALLSRWRTAIDRIAAPSRAMAAILIEQGWPVTDILPHAVAAHARKSDLAETPVFAYAGRLVAEKGVGWLLRAFAAARVPGATLDILGDGPERGALSALAATLGVGDAVRFHGHLPRDAAQRLLERAWVQIVPSLWPEPFGLVAAEALARGTACIVSDAGAPCEIVEDGRTGLVVPADDIAALAAALARLGSDRALCKAMGESGRAVAAERYSEAGWIDAYGAIYQGMLSDTAGGRAA